MDHGGRSAGSRSDDFVVLCVFKALESPDVGGIDAVKDQGRSSGQVDDARPGVVAGRGPAHLHSRPADGFHVARQRRHHRGADVRSAAQRQQPSQHLHHQPRDRRPHRPHLHHDTPPDPLTLHITPVHTCAQLRTPVHTCAHLRTPVRSHT